MKVYTMQKYRKISYRDLKINNLERRGVLLILQGSKRRVTVRKTIFVK